MKGDFLPFLYVDHQQKLKAESPQKGSEPVKKQAEPALASRSAALLPKKN